MAKGSSKAKGGANNVKPMVGEDYEQWGSYLKGREIYYKNEGNYEEDYNSLYLGVITKREAGIVYKAVKNEDAKASPELTKMLYNDAEDASYLLSNKGLANERYNQGAWYYEAVEALCHSIVNKDYKTAQALVNDIEYGHIEGAGKKSRWYKYRKDKKNY